MSKFLSESSEVQSVHWRILAFAFIGWVFDFYDLLLLSFVIASTTITQDLNLSGYDVSVLLGASLGFTAVGGLVGGWLADLFGRKPMLMVSILIYSVGTAASGVATDMWTLMAARMITGLGVGAEWAVAHALVGETVPPHVRGRFGCYLQSGTAFGRFFATLGGNFLAPWIGWRWAFLLSALPALVVVFIRRHMPESDIWMADREKKKQAGHSPLRVLSVMVGPALRKTTALAFTLTLLNMTAFWFKNIWLPVYFHQVRGLSLTASATLFFMEQLGSLAGFVALGVAADRIGRRPSFCAGSVLKAFGVVMITVGWSTLAEQQVLLLGLMFLLGMSEATSGILGPVISELFPTSVRGAALGIIYNVARGVQFVGPVMIALVATRFGLDVGIALAAPFAFLAALFVWALPETKGKRLTPEAAPTEAQAVAAALETDRRRASARRSSTGDVVTASGWSRRHYRSECHCREPLGPRGHMIYP